MIRPRMIGSILYPFSLSDIVFLGVILKLMHGDLCSLMAAWLKYMIEELQCNSINTLHTRSVNFLPEWYWDIAPLLFSSWFLACSYSSSCLRVFSIVGHSNNWILVLLLTPFSLLTLLFLENLNFFSWDYLSHFNS